MHIIIKNKKLSIDDYKVKCAIGKRGIGIKKKEGDLITPKGMFKIRSILYRKDRIKNLRSKIKKIIIKKNMGWCDDPKSWKYNKIIKFPFNYSAERLHKKDHTYDIVVALDYNFKPIKKNKGSAIFIHIAKKKFQNTAGCIAIEKKYLKKIVKIIDSKTVISIN